MPSWSDDEGRCHFEVNGVPCYQSPIGCPAHGGATSKAKRPTQGERDAYRRGAEAMRECAVAILNREIEEWGRGINATALCIRLKGYIQSTSIPEDKP